MEKGFFGQYSGNARHSRTPVTKKNYRASVADDAAHIHYLKEDINYDAKHGHSDKNMTADEKHISKLAGVPCMLNVVEGKNGKPRVTTVMPVANAEEVPPQYYETIIFSVPDYQQGDTTEFNKLSEGIRRIVLKSKELEGTSTDMGDENNGADLGEDVVPF